MILTHKPVVPENLTYLSNMFKLWLLKQLPEKLKTDLTQREATLEKILQQANPGFCDGVTLKQYIKDINDPQVIKVYHLEFQLELELSELESVDYILSDLLKVDGSTKLRHHCFRFGSINCTCDQDRERFK